MTVTKLEIQKEIEKLSEHLKREVSNSKNGSEYLQSVTDTVIAQICYLKDIENQD